jgi:hypothetical protein
LTSYHLAAAAVYTEADYSVEMRFELKAISLFAQKVAAHLSAGDWTACKRRR